MLKLKELLKLNGIEFHGQNSISEEAVSLGKKIEQQRQRSYHKRPQAVVNNFPENQDAFKKPNVLSGNLASKNVGTYRNKNNKVFLIGDNLKEIGLILNVSQELMPNSWIITLFPC